MTRLQTGRLGRWKTGLILSISFFIPVLVMLLVYQSLGFYPFGEKSVLLMDMSDQYVAFYSSLREIVSGQSSIFFSWSKSFGSNYIGLFAYYLSSPLSFLTLLFPQSQLPLAILWLTVLKISLCGLTMAIYLRFAFGKNTAAIVLFSVCYALMSYNLVYSLSLMWLDAVIWLPIILLGLERILKGKSPVLFLLSLAVLFISTYYISYMVGIFCVIYFFFRCFTGERQIAAKDFFQKVLVCACSVLLAFGLAAWLLVPTITDLLHGKIGGYNYTPDKFWNFQPFAFLSKLLPGNYDSITNSGLPAVFCGMLVLLLVLVYFASPAVRLREKLSAGGILVFFILSFSIRQLDMFWHVFQYPNWFPYRYAFLFSFFMIFLAYRGFISMEQVVPELFAFGSMKKLVLCITALVLAVGYTGGELFYNAKVMLNGLDSQFHYKTVEEYNSFYEELRPLVDYAKSQGNDFYRIEKDFEFSKNDALRLGYNGITHYSSAYNRHINETAKKLGFAQYYFWNSYFGSTPVTDSLFGVRYIMSKDEMPEFYRPVMTNGSVTLYENPYYLSIGIQSSAEIADFYIEGNDYFATQNHLLSAVCGEDAQVFREIEFEKEMDGKRMIYRFTADARDPYYLSLVSNQTAGANIYVNGKLLSGYFSGETKCCLYLGTFAAGEEVEVVCDIYRGSVKLLSEDIYALDTQQYIDVMTALQKKDLDVSNYQNSEINGTVEMEQDGYLFTSIPFDSGFTVWVDGEKAEYTAFSDTFLLLPLSAGTHEIRTSYVPRGFWPGFALTALSVLLLAVWGVYQLFKQKRSQQNKSLSAWNNKTADIAGKDEKIT